MTDATYKLVYEGFPIITIGTVNKEKCFHPFGLAVCSDETLTEFSFVFPVGDRVVLTKKECREFLENLNNSKISDFDEYMMSITRLHIIKINLLT
jgi:hypothetical protein